jgi:hypothetical protein
VAVEQSVASNVADVGTGALMAGAEAAVEAAFRGALARAGFNVDGSYARVLQVSLDSGQLSPADSLSANLGAGAGFSLSPLADLSMSARGYLATRLGMRAGDALAARDPFLFGQRLQYSLSAGPDLSITTSRRASVHLGGGYEQAGALSAEDPSAAGVDAHTGRANVSYSQEIGPVDALTPELRYEYTHYHHALLDTDLHRGPADIHSGSALLSLSHDFSRNLSAHAGGGVTIASPPPILRSDRAVVSPAALAGLTYLTARYRLTASYRYEYASLGPRIGFGHEHEASASVSFRPAPGGAYRDFVVTGTGRFSAGVAPVGANPPLHLDLGAPPPPAEGKLSTVTAVAGAEVEFPITRGLALRGGVDLELVHATLDPAPAGGAMGASLRTIVSAGIAGTLSTNPHRTLRRDPDSAWDDEQRASRIQQMPGGRFPLPAPVEDLEAEAPPGEAQAPPGDAAAMPP